MPAVFYLLWALVATGPAVLGLILACSWHPNALAVTIALLGLIAGCVNVGLAIRILFRKSGPARPPLLGAGLGLAAALSPIVVRVTLPWEEPGTGNGSPLAVLLNVVIGTVIIAVLYGGTVIPILIAFAASINGSYRHPTRAVRHCWECRLVVREVATETCPRCGKPMTRARQRLIRP